MDQLHNDIEFSKLPPQSICPTVSPQFQGSHLSRVTGGAAFRYVGVSTTVGYWDHEKPV